MLHWTSPSQDEAFGIWKATWAKLYEKDSPSENLINYIHDSYFLVNLVDNDFPLDTCLWKIVDEMLAEAGNATANGKNFSHLPQILSNLGHFLIISIFIGSVWPLFSENTAMLYQQALQLGPCFSKWQLMLDWGLPRFPINYFVKIIVGQISRVVYISKNLR